MSAFFAKSVHDIDVSDVRSLREEGVQENIRLEYKRQLTADFKDVFAKELSAFANTYGGYVVIGVATDQQGNPIAMDGVSPINNFAQRISSVGYEQIYPPLVPTVSNPIPLDNGNVVYVMYQELSLEAPHFLTHRRGAYVRTSEFSQTFQAQLASWEELQFLSNRRSLAIGRRLNLQERTEARCKRMLPDVQTRTALSVWVGPSFPISHIIHVSRLQEALEKVGLLAVSGVSLQDSLVYAEKGSRNRYIEGTAYGTYYSYGTLLPTDAIKVHLGSLCGSLLAAVKSGCKFLAACGFNGMTHVKVELLNIHGKEVYWHQGIDFKCTEYKEVILVDDETPFQMLRGDIGPFCVNLFKIMMFAAGISDVFKGNDDAIIEGGLKSISHDRTFLSI